MSAFPARVLVAVAFCTIGAAAQAQERAADKQIPNAAAKQVPNAAATKGQPGAWKWSPVEKNTVPPSAIRADKQAPGVQARKDKPLPPGSVPAYKQEPGTKQSLNPQPLPPRELGGTMAR